MSARTEAWLIIWQAELNQRAYGSNYNRGRSIVRGGGVIRAAVQPGLFSAKVATDPSGAFNHQRVSLSLPTLSDDLWGEISLLLNRDRAALIALLGGNLPDALVELCRAAATPLLPNLGEVAVKCEYDGNYFCKHVIALSLKLGQLLASDPFTLLHLRGRARDQLLAPLGLAEPTPPRDPLPTDRDQFWGLSAPQLTLDITPAAKPLASPPTLLTDLDEPPFWRGRESFIVRLTPTYQRVSEAAIALLQGKALHLDDDEDADEEE